MYLVWYLQTSVALILIIQCVVVSPSTLHIDDNENAECTDDGTQECVVASSSSSQPKPKRQFLTPTDLPSLNVFNDYNDKTTVTIRNKSESKIDDTITEQEVEVDVIPGSIQQLQQKQKQSNNNNNRDNNDDENADTDADADKDSSSSSSSSSFKSEFALLPEIVPRNVIEEILTLLRGHENATLANGRTSIELNNGPDSVDGYTTQEFYLDNDIIRHSGGSDSMEINNKQQNNNNNNNNDGIDVLSEDNIKQRQDLRKKLHIIMDPYQDKITKVLHSWLPEKCANNIKGSGRSCTPCYSLIRRYRAGERTSHAPHLDGHSFVTVVVSFSDYGTEYTGGLFVSTNVSDRKYIPLNRGDGILHQGDLHHGVRVLDERNDGRPSERWSWIMWFRDSETCQDHKSEWYESCPGQEDGNPICTYLQATAASPQNVLHYLQKASNDGHPQASVKLGWAYLKALQSELPFDIEKAKELFMNAIESSNDPDGHYGLSTIYLAQIKMKTMGRPTKEQRIEMAKDLMTSSSSLLLDAIYHLEEAAKCGHVFAMFNLGIAAFYGYGRSVVTDGQPQPQKDPNLAAEWFEASGLPEGLAARSMYEMSIGNKEKSILYEQRATLLGYGSSWRKEARQKTGSGGFVGASLNLQWPPIYPTGETPQEW